MSMKEIELTEIDIKGWQNKLIIIDIDGTLLADNTEKLETATVKFVQQVKLNNQIWLSSNSKNAERNQRIADQLGVSLIKTQARKPSKEAIGDLPKSVKQLKKIVIGDKCLTDGFFAGVIEADFIKVKRKSGNDRLHIRIYNIFDNFCYSVLKKWSTFS